MHTPASNPAPLPSLLQPDTGATTPAAPPASPRARRTLRLPAFLQRRGVQASLIAAAVLVGGLALFFLLRPTPKPDFAGDPMDEVLNYTLLTEDFNRLPVQQRLDMITQLISRLRSMSGEDSAAMAMFAATIEGRMREQMLKNASLLAGDMWDSYAARYATVPAENRAEFLDQTFVNFGKTLESLSGETRDVSDEDRLKEGREQARRDKELFQSGKGPGGGQLSRMSDMMNNVGRFTPPQQQARAQQLMRDMTRHLRGEDQSSRSKAR
jgi:hypothetical protein